jgi:GT2 family glycosyltransferase
VQAGDVTLVVVPRDHFSDTEESLESILQYTVPACPIVYVDGGSPGRIAAYLRKRADSGSIRLLRFDHYLTPNQARNIGAAEARTPYIVFVDNDVVVAPDWLALLVECAETHDAAVVGPLNYEKRPLHHTVHFAGGDAKILVTHENGSERRRLFDRIHKVNVPAEAVPTDAAEFHCMLVRTSVFQTLGGLDEQMLSTRENIDFCLAVQQAGGKVYLEPRSRITYLPPIPLSMSDVPFFALRWSDLWDLSSFHRLRDKWHLDEDDYFRRQYENLGWRRREIMMREGVLRWLVSYRLRIAAERMLRPLERRVNATIAKRHSARFGVPLRAS